MVIASVVVVSVVVFIIVAVEMVNVFNCEVILPIINIILEYIVILATRSV